jgi:1,4-dihydroxy-6-naphthoate synthase
MAFDQIMDAVGQGEVPAGVIIHEGQVTYTENGLHGVVDLGAWWKDQTGLPLPLGLNVVRRGLGAEAMTEVCGIIRDSVRYGLENRLDAIKYAQDFGRNLIQDKVDEFVSMYVNDFTLNPGKRGRLAIEELLLRGAEAGITPPVDSFDFID